MANLGAFAVHVLTASGAAFAFVALILATLGAFPAMFGVLGLALIVDGIDGPLARRLHVDERLPRWSGEVLDLVVDYLTYVFVPAYALTMSGMLPLPLAVACGVVIVITGALYFADGAMKMDGHYFRGFPALWNLAVFYLFVLTPPPWAIALVVAVLAALTFAPIPFLHPVRVVRWRALTLAATALWAVLAMVTVYHGLAPGHGITAALCVIAVYFVLAGLTRRKQAE